MNFINFEITKSLPINDKKNSIGWWYKEEFYENGKESVFTVLNLPPNIGYFDRKHKYCRFRNLGGRRGFFENYIVDRSLLTDLGYRGKDLKIISKFNYTGIPAWTWEDLRLYLDSRGFRLALSQDTYLENYFCIDIWFWEKNSEGYVLESIPGSTYEEAREKAVFWILNHGEFRK